MCNQHTTGHKKEHANHDAHHEEWSRRSFLQAIGIVGGGSMLLGGSNIAAANPSPLGAAISQSDTDRVLIIVRLKGGNDGLNTIVPLAQYDAYANLRPDLRLQNNELINLTDQFAIPNYMNSLESFWGDGKMKVVNGVGYENQNLSHFRSSDIWASTQPETIVQTGWFGRYFEELYPDYLLNPPATPAAIQIGSVGNLIFDGVDNNYAFTVANPGQLSSIATNGVVHDLQNLPDCSYGDQLGFMRSNTNTLYQYAGIINTAYENASTAVTYDSNDDFANQLSIVARLIKGNLGTKVYMVSIGGFDTHANQEADHQNLLNRLSSNLKLFYDDLGAKDSDVLTMTISEFGRRVEQNGSMGTDHGTCAPMMLFGPALNGNGFIGDHPSITDLDQNGNMNYGIDFRRAYTSVLTNWLCLDPAMVNAAMAGEIYEPIDFGFECQGTLSVDDLSLNSINFQHFVTYNNEQTVINYKTPAATRVVTKLFNILGQEISTLQNEFVLEGLHSINVRDIIGRRIPTGQYIYRISTGRKNYSKSFLVK